MTRDTIAPDSRFTRDEQERAYAAQMGREALERQRQLRAWEVEQELAARRLKRKTR